MSEPLSSKRIKPDPSDSANNQLLKKLRAAAVEREQGEALADNHLHQSVREWEVAKHSLNEIQELLIQAYKDLELMQPRR